MSHHSIKEVIHLNQYMKTGSNTRVKNYLQTHKKIKNTVIMHTTAKACGCVNVKDVANEVKVSQKTARIHLDIMEIDGVGSYLDSNRKIFCSKDGVDKLQKRINRK